MVDRIVYATPDLNIPSGGVRVQYRHVELLRQAGYDAVVWHCSDHTQVDWFDHDAPVVRGAAIDLDASDTLVLPEGFIFPGSDPAPGCRKVIFNQNHFYAFTFVDIRTYPRWEPMPSMWVVSETSRRIMSRLKDELALASIRIIPCAVDTRLFRPAVERKRKVVWMPRKRPREAALIHALLTAHHRSETDVVLKPIDGLGESATAAELSDASVFVALGRDEGFGLPVAEALAAGCVVVGYPGGGGAELFEAPGTFPIHDSDALAVAGQVRASLAAEPSNAERLTYRRWVERRYSKATVLHCLEQALREARAQPAKAGRATHLWPQVVQRYAQLSQAGSMAERQVQ